MLIFRGMPCWFRIFPPFYLALVSFPLGVLTFKATNFPLWTTWGFFWCLMFICAESVLRALNLPPV